MIPVPQASGTGSEGGLEEGALEGCASEPGLRPRLGVPIRPPLQVVCPPDLETSRTIFLGVCRRGQKPTGVRL